MRKRVVTLLATAVIATLTLGSQAGAAPSDDAQAAAAGTAAVRSILANQTRYAPFTLSRGQSLSSNTARLTMQTDGNLVIYDEFNRARWASNTVNRGWSATLQGDGNFVVYTASLTPVWASNTAGHPGSRLVVQDDGNVVVYDGSQAVWASGTNH
ncbi:hypothetical protein ABZ490_22295 [Streptomyces sp. NPDC005811]|uniref:hypothetical protein n=1 Tax=Streptomyces sp. NPDC005811 TaxID=3154565 RepID=UPI0033C4EEC5